MKFSHKPRHFAPGKKKPSGKNHPGHRSSGRGDKVIALDPFQVMGKIVPWLKKHLAK